MHEPIIITKDLDIKFSDLSREVCMGKRFTLKDLMIIATHSSEIDIETMSKILFFPYLKEYYEEMMSKPFENSGDIEYLEIYWSGEKSIYGNKIETNSCWYFRGVGKKGVVSEDVKDLIPEKEKPEYRENISISFSPMYKVCDYEVRMFPKMVIEDRTKKTKKGRTVTIDFQPSINLIDLLESVFFEISVYGNIRQREELKEELGKRIENLNSSMKISIPWEDVKKRIDKKIEEIKSKKGKQ